MIKFRCVHCGHKISAQDELAERRVKCPKCGQATTVHREDNGNENGPNVPQVVEASPYTVNKSLLGKQSVKYQCPLCGAELSSPLEEAGQTQPCPTCHGEFILPGRLEHEQMVVEAERRAAQEQSERLRAIELAAAATLAKDQGQQRKEQQKHQRRQRQTGQLTAGKQVSTIADGFLHWTFAVAKYISIVVVALCFCAIAFCGIRLMFVRAEIEPFTPRPVPSLQTPQFAEFQRGLPAPEQPAQPQPPTVGTSLRPPRAQSNPFEARVKKLAETYALASYSITRIRVKLGLDFDASERLTRLHDDQTREALLSGLEQLLSEVKSYGKKSGANAEATPDNAVFWYLRQFEGNEDAVQRAAQAAEEARREAEAQAAWARARAREERMNLITIIGAAVGALLSFLILPLLIHIERNTRKSSGSRDSGAAAASAAMIPAEPSAEWTNQPVQA